MFHKRSGSAGLDRQLMGSLSVTQQPDNDLKAWAALTVCTGKALYGCNHGTHLITRFCLFADKESAISD